MALIIKDRVKETTTTTGTGTVTLAGASTGFRSFADIGTGNTTYYTIAGQGTNEWEVGLGTYTLSGTTLSRDTVLSNSLGTTALISFSAGTKDVFCTYPSGKAILGDTSAVGSTGTGSVVLSDSPTFTTAITSTGALQLTGSDTVNQNIASSQTSGNLQIGGTAQTTGTIAIGGTSATGAIILGQSTGAQTIYIGNGSTSTSIVNIGGTGGSTGAINIGRSTGTQTITIGSGNVTTAQTRTINIGTTSTLSGISNVTIGKYSATVAHTTNIYGNTVSISAATLNLTSIGSLTLPANTKQYVSYVADLAGLTGVAQGSRAFVSDAVTPQAGAIVVDGGGTGTPTPVFYDGTNWICDSGLGTTTGSGSVVLATRPTMSVTGAGFTLQDATDNTKQANFVLSGLTTGTSYTYALPALTGSTLAVLGLAQTFSTLQTFGAGLTVSSGQTTTLAGNVTMSSTGNAINIGTSQTTGGTIIGNTAQTGSITLGRPTTTSQTINIANAVLATGNTQTINIGASGASGSTTAVTIGGTAGTSTTTMNGLVKLQTYTVATLPTGSAGAKSFVTNALSPTFGAAVVGGGAVGVPVYHDGTSWKVG
jgi:hypothetical protein